MEQPDSSPQYNAQYIDNDSDSENIVLKPSVELIPDEYEHVDNKAALVHIFRGEYKHDLINCERFRGSLVKIGYEVPDENVHFIRTKEQVQRDLEKSDAEGKSCLIILFLDVYKGGDELVLHEEPKDHLTTKDVWINFTGYKCANLINKPKIFIFSATKYLSRLTIDSARVNDSAYDVPAEADILIVYKRIEDDALKRQFVHEFCDNIDKNGQRDDIITLITQTDHPSSVKSLVISTLTKKFYFTPSPVRDHHLDLRENHVRIREALGDVHEKVGGVLANPATAGKKEAKGGAKMVEKDSPKKAAKKPAANSRPPWRY